MKYQQATKVLPLTNEDLKKDPQITSARRILLILLSIQLGFKIIDFIQQLGSARHPAMNTISLSVSIACIAIVYYISYIVVVINYWRTVTHIFAWLTLIELITVPILVIIEILQLTIDSAKTNDITLVHHNMACFVIGAAINAFDNGCFLRPNKTDQNIQTLSNRLKRE